jgi:hypothetical protein
MPESDYGVCSDCGGPVSPIRIIDKTHHSAHADLEYTVPEARRSMWTGRFPIEGKVEADMCGQCGRIRLYGVPRSAG